MLSNPYHFEKMILSSATSDGELKIFQKEIDNFLKNFPKSNDSQNKTKMLKNKQITSIFNYLR